MLLVFANVTSQYRRAVQSYNLIHISLSPVNISLRIHKLVYNAQNTTALSTMISDQSS
jgi:hypothetical protein